MNSFYQASITFTSQNVGAHKVERIKPILWWSLLCSTVAGCTLGALAVLFGEQLLGIYTPGDAEVISYGLVRLRLICLTYFTCGLMDVHLRLHTRPGPLRDAHARHPGGRLRAAHRLDLHHLRGGPHAVHALSLLPRELGGVLHRQHGVLRHLLPQLEAPRGGVPAGGAGHRGARSINNAPEHPQERHGPSPCRSFLLPKTSRAGFAQNLERVFLQHLSNKAWNINGFRALVK